MENPITPSNKKNIVLGAKVLGIGLIGFLVAPMVFLAIKGIVGLMIAVLIGLVGINFVPVVIDALANMKLVGIKWLATKNPIETLQNDYIKKRNNLAEYRETITMFSSSIMTFEGKYKKFKIAYPEDNERFDDILKTMKNLLKLRTSKYMATEKNLDAYSLEIEKAKAIWEMSEEARKMNAAAGLSKDVFLDKLRVETSLDAIEKNLNQNFAELQLSLIEQEDEKVFVNNITQQPIETTAKVV